MAAVSFVRTVDALNIRKSRDMAAGEASDMAQLGATIVRLERRIEELAVVVERQDDKLDRLLALTAPEGAEQGPKLHELLAELVRVTTDNTALLQRFTLQLGRGV